MLYAETLLPYEQDSYLYHEGSVRKEVGRETLYLRVEAEEGFEISLFVEAPGGGGDEGEEEEDQKDLFTAGTGSLDRDCGILERGEGWSCFLNLHLCLLDLAGQLTINRALKFHFIF